MIFMLLAAAVALAQTPEKPLTPADAMRQSIEKQRAAVEKQREAARRQAETANFRTKPGDPPNPSVLTPPGQANCDPLSEDVLNPLIADNPKAHAVKPDVLRAVIELESAGPAV
jgi:hypothetical protein